MFVVNSQSIHKVVSDPEAFESADVVAVVVHVKYEVLKFLIPDMDEKYFETQIREDSGEAAEIIERLTGLRREYGGELSYRHFLVNSLLNRLLYLVCRNGLKEKNSIVTISGKKNTDTLRGILEYVSAHYREPVQQAEIAREFFFTKESFSRFFKKNTGMTFGEYLRLYRVKMARKELLESDRLILDIAVDNGFPDARGLSMLLRQYMGWRRCNIGNSIALSTELYKLYKMHS